MFFQGAKYRRSRSAVLMHPEEGVASAVVWTTHRRCPDHAAGPEVSSTDENQLLRKFCRRIAAEFARYSFPVPPIEGRTLSCTARTGCA